MKVVRVGLENAASVADVLLLSEATLTEIEEKREEPQPPGWPVAALDRERMLVFDIRRPRLHVTWSFLLTPLAGDRTRLVLRYRGLVQPRLAELPLYALIDVGEFLMTRRMLLGIRTRAERLARRRAAHARMIPSFTAL